VKYSKTLTIKITLALVAFTLLASLNAAAQKSLAGKFAVVEELRWGTAVLPAGEYVFTVESMQSPVRVAVRSADGRSVALLTSQSLNRVEGGKPFLLTTRYGDHRQVRFLNLPALGVALVYEPLSRQERLQLKQAELASVAVSVSTD
jgi:hypothetical protein